jgi:hypothetical protein
MQALSELGSSAVGKWLLATGLALGLALSVGALGASAVAAKSKPKHHHTTGAQLQDGGAQGLSLGG